MSEYVELTDLEFEQFRIRCQLLKLSEDAGEPDNPWDGDQTHFFLSYDFEKCGIFIDFTWNECHGDIYFPTRESAYATIEKIGVERLIKYWFGIPHVLDLEEG